MGLGDLDLVEDEPQIFGVDGESVSDRCGLRTDGRERVQSEQQDLAEQKRVAPSALVTHSREAHLQIPPCVEVLRVEAFDKALQSSPPIHLAGRCRATLQFVEDENRFERAQRRDPGPAVTGFERVAL
ncbi:MAG: hypothetical protein E6J85_02755 [Deltaproteobacteria bacterium]|nr:MAG: hypothetical protein E6J85_02755 [Deltaproteobacteria bacterium]